MPTPPISYATAAALCADQYTGMPALDDPIWQGAEDTSRSTIFEDWAICWDPIMERASAQNQAGRCAIGTPQSGWEEI